MAPKNKKKNGFYYYMKEMQEREAAKGCVIPMSSMPNYAHPNWKKMSVAEKEPYEEMAREYNKNPSLRGGRLASDGTRIEDNFREEEEKILQKNKKIQDVKHFCNVHFPPDEFVELNSTKLLYFMSFNILCKTEDAVIPIEVGLVEYSIKSGINREYTKILNPGKIPFGYTNEAKRLSTDIHNIDIFGGENESNMRKVYNEIKTFTNPAGGDEYPPLFCSQNQYEIVQGSLEWLAQMSGEENVFEVFEALQLLMQLRAGVGEPFPSETIASDLLKKTSFSYHPSTRCSFHDELDNSNCALNYSKCLCYLISDAVCPVFNVTLTEKHIPTLTTEEKGYTVTVYKEPQRSVKPAISLNKMNSYYENSRVETSDQKPAVKARPVAPRQPATISMAEQFGRLNLTPASVPGAGVGRGIRRK